MTFSLLKKIMKLKSFFLITTASLGLTLLISPIRGFGSVQLSSLVGFILYFVLTVFFLTRSSKMLLPLQILAAMLLGIFIFQLPIRSYYFIDSLRTFPEFILHLLGIISGFLFITRHRLQKWLPLCFSVAIIFLMLLKGYNLWFHRLSYGTFSGKVSYALPVNFEAFDQNKNLITDKNFSNKVVLLDFWFTRCGACFQKFPKLQQFYEKHKDNKTINILAVDSPLDDDKEGQAFQMIKDEGYGFPVVISKDTYLGEKLGVKVYPTTFVIDQQGKIVFRGDIERATKLAEELIKSS